MNKVLTILIVILSAGMQAQQRITVEQAIDIALKKNFDIKIARNDADISRINNTKGNAGMLPSVKLGGSGSYGLNNINQKLTSGTTNKYSSQSVTDLSLNAAISWTLYDGGKMFITKSKLAKMQALGEVQFKTQVLDILYNVIASYYDIVREKQQLNSINEVINYNKQRVKIAETGFNAGTLAKTEMLQAQIDLNVAMESAINQKYAIDRSKKTLNSVLGEEPTVDYEVMDSIPFVVVPDKYEMLMKLETTNADLQALKKQIEVSELAVKEASKGLMPRLSLDGDLSLARIHYSEGSTTTNRTMGMLLGGTLSVPLYDAGETKRKVALARNDLLTSQFDLENTRLQVKTDLLNAYNDYESQIQLLKIEKDNHQLAKENLDICLQRLQLGQTNSLEVHQAQESYAQSSTRLINFEYKRKIQETRLKQLISEL